MISSSLALQRLPLAHRLTFRPDTGPLPALTRIAGELELGLQARGFRLAYRYAFIWEAWVRSAPETD